MDQLISFERDPEYLVVDTSLPSTLASLTPLVVCDTHDTKDADVERRQSSEAEIPRRTSERAVVDRREPEQPPEIAERRAEGQQLPYQAAEMHPGQLAIAAGVLNISEIVTKGSGSSPAESTANNAMTIMHNYSSRTGPTASSSTSGHGGFRCFQCKLLFTSEPKVVAHYRSVHSRIVCHHCRLLRFDTYGAYNRHVKESHIECPLCRALIKHKTALQKHLSRYHPERSDRLNIACRESECSHQAAKVSELAIHLKVDHNLPIVAKTETVSSWEAVQQWIVNEELSHNVKFVVRNSYRSGESIVRRYWCYWNALFQRERELHHGGQLRPPPCTAFCTVDINNTRPTFVIKACLSHYGHSVEEATVRCSLSTCDQVGLVNRRTGRSVRFFKPPEEDRVAQQWLALLNTREKRDVLICSRHFRTQDFYVDPMSKMTILNISAVPSVFDEASLANDPCDACRCQHADQCLVVREKTVLAERVSALELEVAMLRQKIREQFRASSEISHMDGAK
ncbi:hypothetical protein BIW11_13506 [Tropilaelaps mercedesae]|uniref:THAP-type domain-containing protein n=1 Tax=Tropilaelaps mercedesae TaxID=418985 RepID=A0A1V9X1K0_9ACAR|nr:hypothetical protein BIW11_13506 [Tropilaelaps mercedesae]